MRFSLREDTVVNLPTGLLLLNARLGSFFAALRVLRRFVSEKTKTILLYWVTYPWFLIITRLIEKEKWLRKRRADSNSLDPPLRKRGRKQFLLIQHLGKRQVEVVEKRRRERPYNSAIIEKQKKTYCNGKIRLYFFLKDVFDSITYRVASLVKEKKWFVHCSVSFLSFWWMISVHHIFSNHLVFTAYHVFPAQYLPSLCSSSDIVCPPSFRSPPQIFCPPSLRSPPQIICLRSHRSPSHIPCPPSLCSSSISLCSQSHIFYPPSLRSTYFLPIMSLQPIIFFHPTMFSQPITSISLWNLLVSLTILSLLLIINCCSHISYFFSFFSYRLIAREGSMLTGGHE